MKKPCSLFSAPSISLGRWPAAAMLLSAVLLLCSIVLSVASWADDAPDDYQIGSGDVLSVTVFDHDELKTKARVSEGGSIEFPLVGTVQVGGLKTSAAAGKIRDMLADGYIVNPQVQIYIEEFKSKKVVVLGQVNMPGLIELSGPTSLLELISKAGGLQKDAGSTVMVTRKTNGKQEVVSVNLKQLIETGDSKNNIQIVGGETISVAAAKVEDSAVVAYITGEVNRPGAYPCGQGATVLKIVSLAGGFTGIASESSVRINRMVEGSKQVLKDVELDAPVLPDDVIEVPESFF